MKKIISLIVAVCCLLSIFTFSVSADQVDNDLSWINIFDYNPGFNRNFQVPNGGTKSMDFDLPFSTRVFYADIVIRSTSNAINLLIANKYSTSTYQLEKVDLGEGLYRYYGYCYFASNDPLTIVGSDSVSDGVSPTGTFLSAAISFLPADYTKLVGNAVVTSTSSTASGQVIQNWSMTDPDTPYDFYRDNTGTINFNLSAVNGKFYDYLDFNIFARSFDVASITASYDGLTLPVYYTYLDTSYYDGSSSSLYFNLLIRVDLTGINRDIDSDVSLSLTGVYKSGLKFSLNSVIGSVNSTLPDPSYTWYQKIIDSINSIGESVGSNVNLDLTPVVNQIQSSTSTIVSQITTSTNSIVSALNAGISDIETKLDSVITQIDSSAASIRTTLGQGFTNTLNKLDAVITQIDTSAASIRTTLGQGFTNTLNKLDAVITQIDTSAASIRTTLNQGFTFIGNKCDSIISTLENEFQSVRTAMKQGFDFVGTKLDLLINGSQADQEAAEEWQDEAADQSGQINDAVGNMEVIRPDTGDVDTSVSGLTGGLNLGLFNAAVLTLTSQGIVAQILLIAVTLMLVAYVFFGKRG